MKVVFIAGPLSGISNGAAFPQWHQKLLVERAAAVGLQLLKIGFAPIIPHLSWYIDPMTTHMEWYAADLEFVRRSDVVLRLPGESKGADVEVAEALAHGIPVVSSIEELRSLHALS